MGRVGVIDNVGTCVVRYDSEAGNGTNKHLGECEMLYEFIAPAQLLTDFWSDMDQWRSRA